MRQDLGRAHRRLGLAHYIGDRDLLPSRIGAPDHGGFGYRRMLVQDALDLGAIDVLAAVDDHVLLAVVYKEIAVRIAGPDVAGKIPAVAQGLAGRRLVAPILEEHVRPAYHHLAGSAGRHLASALIHDARLAERTGRTGEPAGAG